VSERERERNPKDEKNQKRGQIRPEKEAMK